MKMRFTLGVLAYLVPTFALGFVWHLTLFQDYYEHLAIYRKDIIIPFGFLFWKHPEIFLPHYPLDMPHHVLESRDDIIGAFEVKEGVVVPGSYRPNENHQLLSANGIFRLEPTLREHLMDRIMQLQRAFQNRNG